MKEITTKIKQNNINISMKIKSKIRLWKSPTIFTKVFKGISKEFQEIGDITTCMTEKKIRMK